MLDTLKAAGQVVTPIPGTSPAAVAGDGPRRVFDTNMAAGAWGLGALAFLVLARRLFRGSVI